MSRYSPSRNAKYVRKVDTLIVGTIDRLIPRLNFVSVSTPERKCISGPE